MPDLTVLKVISRRPNSLLSVVVVVVVSGIQPEKAQLPKPGRGPPQLTF